MKVVVPWRDHRQYLTADAIAGLVGQRVRYGFDSDDASRNATIIRAVRSGDDIDLTLEVDE